VTFYEARVDLGITENLVINTGLGGMVTWLRIIEERAGAGQETGLWKRMEVPGSVIIGLLEETRHSIHHRGVEPESSLSPAEAMPLFDPEATYTVQLFET